MRVLEILLLVALPPWVIGLFLPAHRRPRWRHSLPALGIVLTGLHVVIEGYRWQMIPSYAVDNKTIAVRTPDFMEAYLTFRALAGVTGLATSRMMVGWLGDVAGGREIMRTLQGKLPSRAERTFEPTGKEIPTSFGKHGPKTGEVHDCRRPRRVSRGCVDPCARYRTSRYRQTDGHDR